MKSIFYDLRKTYFIRKETEDGVKVYECRFKSFLVGGRHVVNNLYSLNIRAVLQIADGTEFIMERRDFERLHFFESAHDALTNDNASFGSANCNINTDRHFSGLCEKFANEHNGIPFSAQGELSFYEWDEKKLKSVYKVCYCAYHTDLVSEKVYMDFDFDKSRMFATKEDCDKANIGGVNVCTFADLEERERVKMADLKRKYDSFLEYAKKYVSSETISLFSMDFFYAGESNAENLKNQFNGIF